MKKLLIFVFIFLSSCSDWKIEQIVNSWNISSWNLEGTATPKVNIKQICDTAKIWERFKKLEEKFWEAIILSESDTWEKSSTISYYYWQIWWEMCMILVSKWEISSKNYLNL